MDRVAISVLLWSGAILLVACMARLAWSSWRWR